MKIPNALKIRPFAFSCMLFIFLSFCFFYLPSALKITAIIFGIIVEIILVSFKSRRSFLKIYILPVLIISASVSLVFFVNFNNLKTYDDKECSIDFVITDINTQNESYSSFTVNVTSVNGKKTDFDSILNCDGFYKAELYSAHSANVVFESYTESDSDRSSYLGLLSKNIYLSAFVTDKIINLNKTVKIFPDYYFNKINEFCSNVLTKHSGEDGSALSRALLLGNKSDLNDETVYHFRLLGLSHMLAVSGLHLSIIIGTLAKLIKKIGISAKKRCFIIISAIIFYAGITGFSSSIKRASIMLIIFYLSTCLLRRNDGITALCFAIASICLFSPSALFDVGLWLSFLSTYGILAVASPLTEKLDNYAKSLSFAKRPFVKFFSLLVFGCVPIIFSLPAIWLSFGEIAIVSPLSNIIFTPLLLSVMYLCPMVVIFSFIPPFASILGIVCAFFSNIMTDLAAYLSRFAPIIPINFLFAGVIIFLLALALMIISLSGTQKKSLYFIPFVCAAFCFALCFCIYSSITAKQKSMIFQSTYQGDIVMAVSNNQAILCDVSGMPPANAQKVRSLLFSKHLTELHSYVITDYSKTKFETIDALLSYTKLDTIYLPTGKNESEKAAENEFIAYADKRDIKYLSYDMDSNSDIEFFGLSLDIRKNISVISDDVNTYCILFSDIHPKAAYVGSGNYTVMDNYLYLSQLLKLDIHIVFGASSQTPKIIPASFSTEPKAKLYFPSDDVFKSYKSAFLIPQEANIFSKANEILLNQ